MHIHLLSILSSLSVGPALLPGLTPFRPHPSTNHACLQYPQKPYDRRIRTYLSSVFFRSRHGNHFRTGDFPTTTHTSLVSTRSIHILFHHRALLSTHCLPISTPYYRHFPTHTTSSPASKPWGINPWLLATHPQKTLHPCWSPLCLSFPIHCPAGLIINPGPGQRPRTHTPVHVHSPDSCLRPPSICSPTLLIPPPAFAWAFYRHQRLPLL